MQKEVSAGSLGTVKLRRSPRMRASGRTGHIPSTNTKVSLCEQEMPGGYSCCISYYIIVSVRGTTTAATGRKKTSEDSGLEGDNMGYCLSSCVGEGFLCGKKNKGREMAILEALLSAKMDFLGSDDIRLQPFGVLSATHV